MVTYQYPNKVTCPDLALIHIDVASSEMTNKTVQWCRWDQDTGILIVCFESVLNESDKAILDTIVQNDS
jgi:hypothetical protein